MDGYDSMDDGGYFDKVDKYLEEMEEDSMEEDSMFEADYTRICSCGLSDTACTSHYDQSCYTCTKCNEIHACKRKRHPETYGSCYCIPRDPYLCAGCYIHHHYAKEFYRKNLGINHDNCINCNGKIDLYSPVEQLECDTCLNRFRKTKRAR